MYITLNFHINRTDGITYSYNDTYSVIIPAEREEEFIERYNYLKLEHKIKCEENERIVTKIKSDIDKKLSGNNHGIEYEKYLATKDYTIDEFNDEKAIDFLIEDMKISDLQKNIHHFHIDTTNNDFIN